MMSLILAATDPLEHVLDHPFLKQAGPQGIWWLTNHMVLLILAALVMLIVFPLITRAYRSGEHVPTGSRNFFEAILLFIRNEVAKPMLGDKTDRFMPFLWTLFFLILFTNLIGMLPLEPITTPIVRAITGNPHAVGVGGTATANIWVTGALALISFVVIQVSGIRANGFTKYAGHFLAGAPWYMAPIMIPVEILGMIVKPVALAIRLMANMTAGHILLAVLIILAAALAKAGEVGLFAGVSIAVTLGSLAIMLLDTFVAFLQSYIFVFLTTIFIAGMVVHEHEEHAEDHQDHDEAHSAIGSGDLTDLDKLPDGVRQAGLHAAG